MMLTCEECGRSIRVRPSWAEHRFCSWPCHWANREKANTLLFWEKVSKSGPVLKPDLGACWTWAGVIGARDGYGRFSNKLAHRIAWVFANGAIPPGLFVCHRCDNRTCVRPDHLFVGTHADNMRDMVAKGRQRAGPGVPKGTSLRLVADDVIEIRGLAKAGIGQKAIAERFAIVPSAVSRIVSRKSWGHI